MRCWRGSGGNGRALLAGDIDGNVERRHRGPALVTNPNRSYTLTAATFVRVEVEHRRRPALRRQASQAHRSQCLAQISALGAAAAPPDVGPYDPPDRHDLRPAPDADHILVLDQGRLVEDRIRAARSTGLGAEPALTGVARRREPRRLRLWPFSAAQFVTTGCRRILPLATLALDRRDHRRARSLDALPDHG